MKSVPMIERDIAESRSQQTLFKLDESIVAWNRSDSVLKRLEIPSIYAAGWVLNYSKARPVTISTI